MSTLSLTTSGADVPVSKANDRWGGDADTEQVANLLDRLWGGPETVIVVSSDLSHYLDYQVCRALDEASCAAIERLDPLALTSERACGAVPVKGLLTAAGRRGMQVKTLDLCNSGDTAGPRDCVVGYGAWAFWEQQATLEFCDDMVRLSGGTLEGSDSLSVQSMGKGRSYPPEITLNSD